MQAVILCGGLGLRLRSVINDIPKPMAPIGEKPFLKYLISHLQKNGFEKILLLTGYKSDVIEEEFKEFDYSVEKEPLGTAGALLNAFEKLEDEFFMINGDTFFDIDFDIFREFIGQNTAEAALVLRATKDISRYGLVEIDDDFRVKKFVEKTNLDESLADGYINSGIYYFKKSVFEGIKATSIEKEIFPRLVDEKKLLALPMGGSFIDIGIPEDYEKAQAQIPKRVEEELHPALFIDRDNTMIEDKGYTHGKNLEFIQETVEFVKNYKEKGFYIFVITNQAGVAKGKFREEDVKLTNETVREKYLQSGVEIDDFIYCPFHELGSVLKYRKKSVFRKPEAGMILSLGEKYKIDYKNSLMYGDSENVDRIKLPYLSFQKKL